MPDAAHQSLAHLRHVTYSPAGKPLLDDLGLNIARHGTTVIMGPNGAGKSTLLRLLAGLLEPTGGSIDWHNAQRSNPVERAFVFQRPVILRRTVAANIRHAIAPLRLPAPETAQRLDSALRACNLEPWRDAPARRLSGGEQQRLAMARALARRPEVLLLDEPTASLDPAATGAIEQIAQTSTREGTKVILVTHDAGQARRLANDIIFLHAGRVLEHSPAASFFDQPDSQAARDYLAGRITIEEN